MVTGGSDYGASGRGHKGGESVNAQGLVPVDALMHPYQPEGRWFGIARGDYSSARALRHSRASPGCDSNECTPSLGYVAMLVHFDRMCARLGRKFSSTSGSRDVMLPRFVYTASNRVLTPGNCFFSFLCGRVWPAAHITSGSQETQFANTTTQLAPTASPAYRPWPLIYIGAVSQQQHSLHEHDRSLVSSVLVRCVPLRPAPLYQYSNNVNHLVTTFSHRT